MQSITTTSLLSALLVFFTSAPLAAATADSIALFEAIDQGQVEVRFIPADAAKANVLIKNNTDRVLQIELPEAIAAVPVLAQLGQGFGQGQGQGLGQGFGQGLGQNGGGGGGTQGVGGVLNGGGNGLGNGFGNGLGNRFDNGPGGGPMMGFMRIAPQKTRRLTATTVCLEYGKPDPHPRVAYRMIPLETFSKDARVIQLCQSLGQGTIDQPTAQAVAWHLANGLSWEKLAGLNRMESRYLGNIKYFKRAELARAQKWFEGLRGEDESTTLSDYPPIAARD